MHLYLWKYLEGFVSSEMGWRIEADILKIVVILQTQ